MTSPESTESPESAESDESAASPESATLRTARLTLREIPPVSAAALSAGGPGGFRWIEGGPADGSRVGASVLAKAAANGSYRPGWGMYALVRTDDGLALGGMGFHGPPLDGRVEIGYDLVPAAQGQGYATEALRALSTWALATPTVTVIVAHTEHANTASQAVLERAGYTRTATTAENHVYELRTTTP
ncbi:GNAT family N-acetyltransferase [Streptomyces apocyni]|uniref:GNAT family N-acetyltransferase n=1 Tax=Streptomyces apocyni TaxID=2654677 RepID=UPI001E5B041D|nr:GNAT family protein [Streptomyces apocyni]